MLLNVNDPSTSTWAFDKPLSELCKLSKAEIKGWLINAEGDAWTKAEQDARKAIGETNWPHYPPEDKRAATESYAKPIIGFILSQLIAKKNKPLVQGDVYEDYWDLIKEWAGRYASVRGSYDPNTFEPRGPLYIPPHLRKKKAKSDRETIVQDGEEIEIPDPDDPATTWGHWVTNWLGPLGHPIWGTPSWPLWPHRRAWRPVQPTPGEDSWPPATPPPSEGDGTFPEYPMFGPRVPLEPRDSFWERLSEAYWIDFLACTSDEYGAGPATERVRALAWEWHGMRLEDFVQKKLRELATRPGPWPPQPAPTPTPTTDDWPDYAPPPPPSPRTPRPGETAGGSPPMSTPPTPPPGGTESRDSRAPGAPLPEAPLLPAGDTNALATADALYPGLDEPLLG